MIRHAAHDVTIDPKRGVVVPDRRHLTIDVKTRGMFEKKRHLTAHGYLGPNSVNDYAVQEVTMKTFGDNAPRLEEDDYFDPIEYVRINDWDVKKERLSVYEEPENLLKYWVRGDSVVELSWEEAYAEWKNYLGMSLDDVLKKLGNGEGVWDTTGKKQ